MPKSLKRTILYGGHLLLVAFLMLEIGVRIWGYSESHTYDPIYTSFEPSEDIPYIHKPNLIQAQARGLPVINTDSLGLRSKTSGTVYGPQQLGNIALPLWEIRDVWRGYSMNVQTCAHVLEDIHNHQQELLL
jgi:hypothetical protein